MSRHYKKLILLLIPACAGFCLALSLGAAEQPSEETQEELNKILVRRAFFYAFKASSFPRNEIFDTNYIHHLPARGRSLTLDATRSWLRRFDKFSWSSSSCPLITDTIAEGDKVVVSFDLGVLIPDFSCSIELWDFYHLSSEICIFRIADDLIVEGWSVSEPSPYDISQEELNKALVKEAICSYAGNPDSPSIPEQFDPNYIQHGPSHDDDVSEGDMWFFSNIPLANFNYELTIEFIIADGDMVSVLGSWTFSYFQALDPYDYDYTQLAIFRIANDKIVEGWIAPARYDRSWTWPYWPEPEE